jgi:hypothetical protein
LESLPKNLSKLEHLRELNVAFNTKIDFNKEIPNIAAIKSLRLLDISYNKVQQLKEQQLKDYMPQCKVINLNFPERKK